MTGSSRPGSPSVLLSHPVRCSEVVVRSESSSHLDRTGLVGPADQLRTWLNSLSMTSAMTSMMTKAMIVTTFPNDCDDRMTSTDSSSAWIKLAIEFHLPLSQFQVLVVSD